MRILDLFSGIGGFSLGLEQVGMTTAAFCEPDPYCRGILARHWPDTPIYNYVEDIQNEQLDQIGAVDLVCGGFPCQPFSNIGQRGGGEDDRHLWPEMLRVIRAARPRWVIGENVPGLLTMGIDEVLSDLGGLEYSTRCFVLPAAGVGAPHVRDRVWILAHANEPRLERHAGHGDGGDESGRHRAGPHRPTRAAGLPARPRRKSQPGVGRGFDGVSSWLDGTWERGLRRTTVVNTDRRQRLTALGNAVCPPLVAEIGRLVLQIDREIFA